MEKTGSISYTLFVLLAFVLASAARASAVMTIVIPDDIDPLDQNQAYDVDLGGGVQGMVLYEMEESYPQESWFKTNTFDLDAGPQKVSFDMGYYSGGGDETDEFSVWLKDASHNIISPVFTSMTFPWKSSEHAGSGLAAPVELHYDSLSGISDVYLHYYLYGDGDYPKYDPTMINISNIQVTTPFIIPAPGGLLLVGMGMVLVGGLRRRKSSIFI